MAEQFFRSQDRRYGLFLSAPCVSKAVKTCGKAGRLETGGILVGNYNEDHSIGIVKEILPPPPDSVAGPSTFIRGTKGVKRELKTLRREKQIFYLGEWHFHPFAAPTPSTVDLSEMRSKKLKRAFHCPEPILLIIGGDPKGKWRARAFVYPESEDGQELFASEESSSLAKNLMTIR